MAAVKRIGLLGGSFDPIHQGHIYIARCAQKALDLDQVWLLPTIATPLKQRQLAPVKDRKAMIEMAIAPYRHLKVSMIEEKNTIPSYSINTARRLKAMYPDYQFFWIIGSDWVDGLDKWKDIDQLRKLVTFVCLRRDDSDDCSKVLTVKAAIHPASSTAVRQGDFRYISAAQAAYIMDHGLYQREIAESTVTEKRWPHVVSVADLAVLMARGNHVDPQLAYQAGLFHDCAKKMSKEEMTWWMSFCTAPENMARNENVWHQYVGAAWCRRVLKLRNRQVLNAIEHHVLGDSPQPLAMIIYAADKLDPSRGYDTQDTIRLCCQDIRAGFAEVKKQQQEYLSENGII